MLSSQFAGGQAPISSPRANRPYITGTGESSPYRQKNNRKGIYNSSNTKQKQTRTLESKHMEACGSAQGQDSHQAETSSQFMASSPCNSRSGTRQNTRGYSLLNPPVNMANFDDSDAQLSDHEQTIEESETVVSKPCQAANSLTGQPFPDLLFRGFDVQGDLMLSVKQRRLKRKNRRPQGQTHRLTDSRQGNVLVQETASNGLTSVTEQRQASLKFQTTHGGQSINPDSAQASQTQIANVLASSKEKIGVPDYTISSSVNTRGFPNSTGMPAGFNGWLALQTQTMSIPQRTLEAQGSRTFRSNAEQSVFVSGIGSSSAASNEDGIARQNKQILATSTLSSRADVRDKKLTSAPGPSKVGKGKNASTIVPRTKMVSSKQALQQKAVAAAAGGRRTGGQTSPQLTQQSPKNQRHTISRATQQQPQVRKPVHQPKKVTTTAQSQTATKSKVEQNITSRGNNRSPDGRASPLKTILSGSPQVSKSRLSKQRDVSKTPINGSIQSRPSKNSLTKNQGGKNQTPGPFKIRTKADQSSSQDQILSNKRSPRKSGSKQVPPPQAGVKRFKTQTRDPENGHPIPSSMIKGQIDDAIESSSFAEDLSQRVDQENNEDGKKIGRLAHNLGLVTNVSVNGDTVRLSDHELSIVESDGGQQELDTPANPYYKKLKHDSFHDAATKTQRLPQNGSSKMSLKSGQHDVGENTPYRQSRTQVIGENFQDTVEAKKTNETQVKHQEHEKLRLLRPKRAANYLSAAEAVKGITSRTPSSKHNKQGGIGQKTDSPTQQKGLLAGSRAPTKRVTGISIEVRGGKENSSIDGRPALAQQINKRNSTTRSENASYGQLKFDRKVVQGGRMQRLAPNDSKRRFVQNMPMCDNTRARNNLAVQTHQFVDSDFYDSHSVHQGTPKLQMFNTRMGSTVSPVSSRSRTSGIMGRQASKPRKSNLELMSSGQKTNREVVVKTQKGGDSSTPLEPSQTTQQHQNSPQKSLKSGEYTTSRNQNQNIRLSSLNNKIHMTQQQTQNLLKENRQRVLGRMYQKKLIERREKQMKILNRQLNEKSDSDSLPMAFAHGESRFETQPPNELSVYESTQSANAKQSGLETLRKIHDSMVPRKKQPRVNQAVMRRNKQRRNRDQNYSKLQKSLNSSIEENISVNRLRSGPTQVPMDYNAFSSYQSLIENGQHHEGSSQRINGRGSRKQQAQSTGNGANSVMVDQGVAQHMSHQCNDERGGDGATYNSEQSPNGNEVGIDDQLLYEDQQAAQVGSVNGGCGSAEKQKTRNKCSQFATSQFLKKPKVRAPQYWQGVIERKFNMIQTEEETVFVPGRVCRSVYRTAPQQNGGLSPELGLREQTQIYNNLALENQDISESTMEAHNLSMQQSPRDVYLGRISNRKKSHELNQIRNQSNKDDMHINKLVKFSMTRKLEQQRGQQLQISGRDDPSNVLGFRKLNIGSATAKNGGSRQRKQQLTPLTPGGRLDLSGQSDDKQANMLQRQVQGMLSDLNRVKNMRIANQNLTEAPKSSQLVQRRDNVAPREGEIDPNRKLALLGQSTQNRPSLLIQTMPSIYALKHAAQGLSQKNARNQDYVPRGSREAQTTTSKRLALESKDHQHQLRMSENSMKNILASSSDLPSKIVSLAQPSIKIGCGKQEMGILQREQREKSVTRLASNGLRIIQTNTVIADPRNQTQ